MIGFQIQADCFSCTPDDFAAQCEKEGIHGIGMARYYLAPASFTFLAESAARNTYPYSMPPASRPYRYDENSCPEAKRFLDRFIRWTGFSEVLTEDHGRLFADGNLPGLSCRETVGGIGVGSGPSDGGRHWRSS
jgi:hypothetical protein